MAIRSFFCQEILKKGSAFPKPYCYGLRRLKTLKIFFRIFQKQFRFTRLFSPISERTTTPTERSDTHSQKLQHAPPQPSSQNTHDRGGIRRLYRPPCALQHQSIRVYPQSHSRRKRPSRCHGFPGQRRAACRHREADHRIGSNQGIGPRQRGRNPE